MSKQKKLLQRKSPSFLTGVLALSLAAAPLAGCQKNEGSFSTLATGQAFTQTKTNVANQVDILWVVDNSFSMDPLQQNLVKNFNTFINNFQAKGFDYKMAVTTSDAYLAMSQFRNDPAFAKFKDGVGTNHTGYYYITPYIPDIVNNFVTAATQGQFGSGDERAFSAMMTSLNSSQNADFHRPGAFFAVIIVSDEDDFSDANRAEGSWNQVGGVGDHSYSNPGLESVDSYIAQLDAFTGSTAGQRNYSVSAITVPDEACRAQHSANAPSTIIGTRYIEMANKTGGVLGSVCDADYANTLNVIQQRIIELSTQFPLSREPNVSTIVVLVDNQVVPQDATNGWTYDATANVITFHGNAVPASGAAVNIYFDPAQLL